MNLVCFAIALIFLCVSPVSPAAGRSCPKTIQNSYECAQYAERELGKKNPELFMRSDQKLTIKLSNGKEKTYTDSKKDDVDGRWYSFVQHYPEIGYALIEVQHYEGGTNYLLNLKTGHEFNIVSYPTISPDKKRIAVSNVDLEARYTPNVLAVYELRSYGPFPEFSVNPTDWGAGNERWINNQEISFTRYSFDSTYKIQKEIKKLKYRRGDDKGKPSWYIE